MRRVAWVLGSIALGAGFVALGCGDDREDGTLTCTLAGCGGLSELALIDDDGNPARARGEFRSTGTEPTSQQTVPFDCAPAPPNAGCSDGVLLIDLPIAPARPVVDVRFELSEGTWSAWQTLDLEITEHTEPDFNGPGCSCTWYTATAAPIVVPAAARITGDGAP
jgi:hypothetical protein